MDKHAGAQRSHRAIAVLLLKVAASAAILCWLVWQAWTTDQFSRLWSEPKSWGWLVVAIAATAGAHLAGFLRWYWMGHALGLPLTVLESVRIGLIGCFFSLVAFGVVGGDTLRAWYAARQSPGRRAEAVASVFLDRAIGMLTMFAFAAAGWWFCAGRLQRSGDLVPVQAIRWLCLFSLAVAVAGFAGLGLMMLVGRFRRTALWRWLEKLPRIGPLVHRVTGIFLLYRHRYDAIGGCIALSVVVNLLFALSIWSVARFLPGEHPGLAGHLVIAPVSMVANVVPLPGGLGSMEAVLGFLYRGFLLAEMPDGKFQSAEVLVAFVFRITLLLVSAAGAVAWFSSSRAFRMEVQHVEAS